MSFRGSYLDVRYGKATRGGKAKVVVDGERVGTLRFGGGDTARARFGSHRAFRRLGGGEHTVRIVMVRGNGYLEGFRVRRR